MPDLIITPCNQAEKCPEDHLNQGWHDNPVDPNPEQQEAGIYPGRGHNEFVPHVEDWYRDPGSGKRTPDGRRRRRALERCWNECPVKVRLACLEAGLAQGPTNQFGIWGGYTEDQREQIITARAEAAVGTEE